MSIIKAYLFIYFKVTEYENYFYLMV